MRIVTLRNACDQPVLAEVRTTQRLFSGTLRQSIPVVVPAGGQQSLGCAWWSGAMAPTQRELGAARFLATPDRREHGRHHHADRP